MTVLKNGFAIETANIGRERGRRLRINERLISTCDARPDHTDGSLGDMAVFSHDLPAMGGLDPETGAQLCWGSAVSRRGTKFSSTHTVE